MGSDDAWIEQVRAAADRVGERGVAAAAARRTTASCIDSEIADLSNIGTGGGGGTLTAGLFLREFVGDVPWVHLDIAGPARAVGRRRLHRRGGTGFGVRTLIELANTFKKPNGKPKA